MPLLVPNASEATMLEAVLNKTPAEDLVLRLYTNNKTPAETDTAASYTEASGSGYAAKSLAGASWSVAGSTASYAEQTFTFSGALGQVYGYFVTQATSGKLMWAERFSDGPYSIANNGDAVRVTLNISLE